MSGMAQGNLIVLGGGPAGLAAAYYARRNGLDVQVYEAAEDVGGNGRTLQFGEYFFDLGAHRLHDRDSVVTADVRSLLGSDLLRVEAPSQIFSEGRFLDFPLSPLNLVRELPPAVLVRAAGEVAALLLQPRRAYGNFAELARATYGKTISERFLLNYSEKLWGRPADQLSIRVAGKRLNGLDVATLAREMILGGRAKTRHLDGAFYYPRRGFGAIFDALADEVGRSRIHTEHRITAIRHDGRRILNITINDALQLDASDVVSTLPLPMMVNMMRPSPPDALLEAARTLEFRHLRLVVLTIDRPRFSANASIYFPDRAVPITRLYEPKNRSAAMAPGDRTAIVLEMPCAIDDNLWSASDDEVSEFAAAFLQREGLLRRDEILGSTVRSVPFAYPILTPGFEASALSLQQYLEGFENLHMVGRSARFTYSHVHDLMGNARSVVSELNPTARAIGKAA